MSVTIEDFETKVVRHALETYLSDLRSEIMKTDKRDWKKTLHEEEDILKEVLTRMN